MGATALLAAAVFVAGCSSSSAAKPRPDDFASGAVAAGGLGSTTTATTGSGSTSTTTSASGTPTSTPAPTTSSAPAPTTPATASPATTTTTAPIRCHYGSYQGHPILPDPTCTPGALNAAVTQANIATTICLPGFLAANQMPIAQSQAAKVASMVLYGSPGSASAYVYNPLVSIEIGGSPTALTNYWPMPTGNSYLTAKKTLSSTLHAMVCANQMPLAVAQLSMSINWITAYQKYVGPLP